MFFGLVAEQVQGLQTFGVQPSNLQLVAYTQPCSGFAFESNLSSDILLMEYKLVKVIRQYLLQLKNIDLTIPL